MVSTFASLENEYVALRLAVSPSDFRSSAKDILCNEPDRIDDVIAIFAGLNWTDKRSRQLHSLLLELKRALEHETVDEEEKRSIVRAMLKKSKHTKSIEGYRRSESNAKRRRTSRVRRRQAKRKHRR